ncbi:MAG: hypothetical protein ACTSP3_00225 [Candidatus Heimdallarchaeaceae archaeon]
MLFLRVLIENFVRFILILIFIINHITFLNITLSWLISLIVSGLFALFVIFSINGKKKLQLDEIFSVKKLLKSGLTVHLGTVLYTFTPLILPTLLIIWENEKISGSFYISWMIANAFYSITIALSIAAIATVKNSNKKQGLKNLIKYYAGLIILAIIVGAFLSKFILQIFNPKLIDLADSFLKFLLFSLIVVTLYQYHIAELRFNESFSLIAFINLIQGSLFFSALFIFKTKYGLLGIGVMFIISILISLAFSYIIFYYKKLKRRKNEISKDLKSQINGDLN